MKIPMKRDMKMKKFNPLKNALLVSGMGLIALLSPITALADGEGEEVVVEDPRESVVVNLYETYNSEYDLYEESLYNLFYFYSNVENGAITSDFVKFDIPGNIECKLEKDGKEIPFNVKSEISAKGNYVLRLTASDENNIYVSSFRFSLRDKPEPVETVEEEVKPEDQVLTEEQETVEGENEGTETEPEVVETLIFEDQNFEMTQTGNFINKLLTGEEYYSSVPNGATVSTDVKFILNDGMNAKVFLNDSEIEWKDTFSADGSYRVEISETSVDFMNMYGFDKEVFKFRIIKNPVKEMRMFNTPKGFYITKLLFNGEAVESENPKSTSFEMVEDGVYTVEYFNDGVQKTYFLDITKDTEGPGVSITIKNQKASVTYEDKIQSISLSKDGVALEGFNANTIKGKGTYVLTVEDMAGNVSVLSFSLGKSINGGSIISIFMVLAIIGGGIYLYMSSKNKMTVR